MLYLQSRSDNVFAAEFEDGDPVSHAEAAAVALNRLFRSATPDSVRVVTRPSSFWKWLAWGGIGVLGLFVLAIYRQLRSPTYTPAK